MTTQFSLHYPSDRTKDYTLEYGALPDEVGSVQEAIDYCKRNEIPLYTVSIHQVDNEGTDEEEHASVNLEEADREEVEDVVQYLSLGL